MNFAKSAIVALALVSGAAFADHTPTQPPVTGPGEVSLREYIVSTCLQMSEPTAQDVSVARAGTRVCSAELALYKEVETVLVVAYNGWTNQVFEKTVNRERTRWLQLQGYSNFSCPAKPYEVDTQETVTRDR